MTIDKQLYEVVEFLHPWKFDAEKGGKLKELENPKDKSKLSALSSSSQHNKPLGGGGGGHGSTNGGHNSSSGEYRETHSSYQSFGRENLILN